MNTASRQQASDFALNDVIEPLADFICAADRPSAVLKTALSTLFRHVEQTNALAQSRIAHFSQPQSA